MDNSITNVQRAYRIIKNMICNCVLLPGQQLIETSLSAECGVSRTPVREAIRLLATEGLVTTEPNRGSFVRVITREDVIMAFEVAAALEGMAAEICARRYLEGEINDELVKILREDLLKMEQCVVSGCIENWMDLDRDFHESIFKYAGNTLLAEKRSQVIAQVEMVYWFSPEPTVERHKFSCDDHRKIFEAILNKNPSLAGECGKAHRMRIREIILATPNKSYGF